MLNKVFVMGRLARDPELRRTQNGTAVAAFTLAVDRDYKDKASGERGVDWIDCIAWSHTGEFVSRYFTKGRMAVVEGRLQVRDWVDQNGTKRRNTEVVCEQVYFGDSKSAKPGEPTTQRTPQAGPPPAGTCTEEQDVDDGELPF